MKKLYAAVLFIFAGVAAVAVLFSPLVALGNVVEYENNVPVAAVDGLCYNAHSLVRVDFDGGKPELYAALSRISAKEIKVAEIEGTTVVYAYSPRVCAMAEQLADGREYNVMAATNGERVCIGTPILPGCY